MQVGDLHEHNLIVPHEYPRYGMYAVKSPYHFSGEAKTQHAYLWYLAVAFRANLSEDPFFPDASTLKSGICYWYHHYFTLSLIPAVSWPRPLAWLYRRTTISTYSIHCTSILLRARLKLNQAPDYLVTTAYGRPLPGIYRGPCWLC